MALEPNCSACEDLRQTSADFTVNGLSEEMCASLGNNTGLSTRDNHDTCEDLNNLNDCLVGNMTKEVAAYPICDWKKFMKNFIPNLWTTLKAIICAFCGIWEYLEWLYCLIKYLFEGQSFSIGEIPETGKQTYVKPGKGVDFGIRRGSEEHTSDVTFTFVSGGVSRLYGSLRLFIESFKDVSGNTKSGNSVWNFEANNYSLPSGGELLYEIRMKKSEYPVLSVRDGDLWYTGGLNMFVQGHVTVFNEGEYAYGQHGWCKDDGTAYTSADGSPYDNTYDSGHLVPDGFRYIQVRLNYVGRYYVGTVKDGAKADKSGSNMTLGGYLGVRMDKGKIDCD